MEPEIIEVIMGHDSYNFSKDPGLREIEFNKAMRENSTSFKSKIGDEVVAISVWTTPKRTKTYPFPRVYSTLGHHGKKITIIPVQASYGKHGDDNKLQPGTISWMSGLGVYVIVGVYTKAKMRPKGKAAANASKGKASTQGEPVFTSFEFENDGLLEQVREIVSERPKVEDWNQKQLIRIPSLLKASIENNRRLGKELGVVVRSFKPLEKKLGVWNTDMPKFLLDCDRESEKAQHREFTSDQKLENVPGKKGKFNVDMGNSKTIFLTADSVSVDKKKKTIEILEGKHTTKGKFPDENDVLDALFKLMIFKKSEIRIAGTKFSKELVCYLSGTGYVTDEEIKRKYEDLITECNDNSIEFRFNDKTIN